MSERKGPEYVRPEVWQAKEEARQRRVRWMAGPMVAGAGLAIGLAIWLPMRTSGQRLKQLLTSAGSQREYHAIERRAGEAAGVLREEYVFNDLRRYILMDGEIELITDTHGGARAYERSPKLMRQHRGAVTSLTTVQRLIRDCESKEAKVSNGPDGVVEVETENRRYEIQTNKDGLPIAWKTDYLTDMGFEPLWETTVTYGPSDPTNFAPGILTSKDVSMDTAFNPHAGRPAPDLTLGDVQLSRMSVNKLGDLCFIVNSPYERPFFEITDANGDYVAPISLASNSYETNGMYRGEFTCIRLSTDPPKWPVTFTIRARNYDPRYKVDGFPNREMGHAVYKSEKPSASLAPLQWFDTAMGDRTYFDFLRTRSYRLSMIFQNAMRTADGKLIDAMNGGAAHVSEDQLKRAPADITRAINELRTVIRLRAEFDSGTLPMAALYTQLASLCLLDGRRDQARSAIAFAERQLRVGRTDASLQADIERISKEASQ